MKKIILTQNKYALVDDDDYIELSKYKWCVSKSNSRNPIWYAVRAPYSNGNQSKVYMHRVILNAPPNKEVDHKDGNGLNNVRCNLRLATKSQNNTNVPPRGISKYSGVTWSKANKKWRACAPRHDFLGYFPTEKTAARAYNQAVQKMRITFARLNPL